VGLPLFLIDKIENPNLRRTVEKVFYILMVLLLMIYFVMCCLLF